MARKPSTVKSTSLSAAALALSVRDDRDSQPPTTMHRQQLPPPPSNTYDRRRNTHTKYVLLTMECIYAKTSINIVRSVVVIVGAHRSSLDPCRHHRSDIARRVFPTIRLMKMNSTCDDAETIVRAKDIRSLENSASISGPLCNRLCVERIDIVLLCSSRVKRNRM